MLADLIGSSPEVDIKKLFPDNPKNRQALETIFGHLREGKSNRPSNIRPATELAILLRQRFGIKNLLPIIDAHAALGHACQAWMAGEDPSAAVFLFHAYVYDPDPEERYDSGIASALTLLGQSAAALDRLDAAKASLPEPVFRSKRARLLRELGRTAEAMKTISPGHHPELNLRLAMEFGDWDAAIRAATNLNPNDPLEHGAIHAGIAEFSEKPRILKRARS